jgi:uncharacterized membrane protein
MLISTTPAELIVTVSGFDHMISDPTYYNDLVMGAIGISDFYRKIMSDMVPIWSITTLYEVLISGIMSFGLANAALNFRREREVSAETALSGFSNLKRAFLAGIVTQIFISLWSLLFIIPGIIATYRYRFTFFVLVDNPNIGVLDAIRVSKSLTAGNKGKLFLLDLTFIGWFIVASAAVSFIVGMASLLSSSDALFVRVLFTLIQSLIATIPYGIVYLYNNTAKVAMYEAAGSLQGGRN